MVNVTPDHKMIIFGLSFLIDVSLQGNTQLYSVWTPIVKSEADYYPSVSCAFQRVVPGPLGVPKALPFRRSTKSKLFSKWYWVFICLFHSHSLMNGIFQRVYDVLYCSRLNVETEMRLQLSSLKPDVNEICKNVNKCYRFHKFSFCFGNCIS